MLRGLNLDIHRAEKVAIIGASGSGKTTLLRLLLMTLERPDSGYIEVEGEYLFHKKVGDKIVEADEKHLRKVRGKIGMVFQQFNLFMHMKVLQNVTEAPVHVLGMQKEEAEERAISLLRMVGLEDKKDAFPFQLIRWTKAKSRHRPALAMEPKIMLFDEITSALDPELVGEVLNIVRKAGA